MVLVKADYNISVIIEPGLVVFHLVFIQHSCLEFSIIRTNCVQFELIIFPFAHGCLQCTRVQFIENHTYAYTLSLPRLYDLIRSNNIGSHLKIESHEKLYPIPMIGPLAENYMN